LSLDFFIIIVCCILALIAHGSRHQKWLEWVLRVIISVAFLGELFTCINWPQNGDTNLWGLYVLAGMCAGTGATLFMPIRKGVSLVLSVINQIISLQVFVAIYKKLSFIKSFLADRVFVPQSIPHMVALWIYITAAGFLLGAIDPTSIKLPNMPIPLPVPLEQLFSYNGLGLVILSLAGVGIMVSRKPQEAMQRLGWAKPTWAQVAIGVGIIFATFAYDYAWAYFTHQMPGGLADKLSSYNAGTFTAGGGLTNSLILALAVALCAGIGEETLIRGALQPCFGILPAAILHGLLHGQFAHAPIFIVQVAGWSALMGIAKRYTNTTTTIIGHAGYNLLTTFLFAFNP
jgi:hypothetical protein